MERRRARRPSPPCSPCARSWWAPPPTASSSPRSRRCAWRCGRACVRGCFACLPVLSICLSCLSVLSACLSVGLCVHSVTRGIASHNTPTHPPQSRPLQVQTDYHTPELFFAGALLSRLSPPPGLQPGQAPPPDNTAYYNAHIDSACCCLWWWSLLWSGVVWLQLFFPSPLLPIHSTNAHLIESTHTRTHTSTQQRRTSARTISAPSSTSIRRAAAPAPPPPGGCTDRMIDGESFVYRCCFICVHAHHPNVCMYIHDPLHRAPSLTSNTQTHTHVKHTQCR